jgi:nucleoside-diphosphate-sugar epimerase
VDIGDGENAVRAIREVQPDAILHAASVGVTEKADFLEMLRSNAVGTDNLLSAAKALKNPPSIVMAGSGYEYVPQSRPLTEDDPIGPTSTYGISKVAATFCAGSYSAELPITVLRIFNVYGPGERLPRLLPYIVHNARSGKPIELTSCEQVRDFAYVGDIASLFWRALECPHDDGHLRILNAGSGTAVRLKDFVCAVVRVLAKRGIKAQVEFGARPYKTGEPMHYASDSSRLRKTLGSFPFTTPEAGIQQSLESM